MIAEQFADAPKILGIDSVRAARREALSARHVAPLTRFVESIREERGAGCSIPDFDPWDGGVDAEILYLLEAPGGRAVGSGFISRNNPDETAKNFFELNLAAGIDRKRTVTWNIVPWYVGSGAKIRPVKSADIREALPSLERLLELLPRLRAIVLIGRKAERSGATLERLRPAIRVFRAPHPSPLFVNAAPGNRQRIEAVLLEVAKFLRSQEPQATASDPGT